MDDKTPNDGNRYTLRARSAPSQPNPEQHVAAEVAAAVPGTTPICTVCGQPATCHVNVTADAAHSVASLMEPRCQKHSWPTLARPPVATAEAREVIARMTPGEWDYAFKVRFIGVRGRWDDNNNSITIANDVRPDDGDGIVYLRSNAIAWLDALDALQGAGEREKRLEAALKHLRMCIAWNPNFPEQSPWFFVPGDTLIKAMQEADAALAPAAPAPASICPRCGGKGYTLEDSDLPYVETEIRKYPCPLCSGRAPASVPAEVREAAARLNSGEETLDGYDRPNLWVVNVYRLLARYVQSLIAPVDDGAAR